MKVSLLAGARVANCWTIDKKLGAGAFGAVYLCMNDDKVRAALKTEPTDADPLRTEKEAQIMRALANLQDGSGKHFCRCLGQGRDVQPDAKTGVPVAFNYIVMTLVGRGLHRLVNKAGGFFSPGTAIGVSIQLLNALKAMHNIGYLHLDIKPENAASGRRENNGRRLVYLLDFGLARRYIQQDGTIKRQRSKVYFRGSLPYASISAHIKRDYSRKDDIESWFYTMVDLFTGSLPWNHLQRERQVGEMKCRRLDNQADHLRTQAVLDLLEGCPTEFAPILQHIDRMDFYDRPQYEMIEGILRNYLIDYGIPEHPYDWEIGRNSIGSSSDGTSTIIEADE